MIWNESSKLYSATAAVLLLIAAMGTVIALPKVHGSSVSNIPMDLPVRLDRAGSYTAAFTTGNYGWYQLALQESGNDVSNATWKLNPGAIYWSVNDSAGLPVETMHTPDVDEGEGLGEFPGVPGSRYSVTLTVKQPRSLSHHDPHLIVSVDPSEAEDRKWMGAMMMLAVLFTVLLSGGFLIAALVAPFKRPSAIASL